jgi:hypothetical protein
MSPSRTLASGPLAAEQHHPVDGVGPQHLLGRHRCQVVPQHRGGLHLGLAEGQHRKVQRDATGLVGAVGDAAGDFVQMRVARVRSEAVFAIAMCGRWPSKASAGRLRRIQGRWM